MEVNLVLDLPRTLLTATHNAVLLMAYGPPGQPGRHAPRHVVEDKQRGQDLVIQEFPVVEGNLVLEKIARIRPAMNNAALFLEDGAHGVHGAHVLELGTIAENQGARPATTLNPNVEGNVHLEHLMRLHHAAPIIVKIVSQKGKEM